MEWHVGRMRDTGERTYCCIVPGVGRVWATSDPAYVPSSRFFHSGFFHPDVSELTELTAS